ncbi:unnamed protein product [Rodentolepis nana]|uniref:Ovule protein n=1 Tax=Rodentolepis nana TaxID=102285 RepID=A0A0R3TYK7_RODNA|nr:unnamed protein product [Rodentolepis nana]
MRAVKRAETDLCKWEHTEDSQLNMSSLKARSTIRKLKHSQLRIELKWKLCSSCFQPSSCKYLELTIVSSHVQSLRTG